MSKAALTAGRTVYIGLAPNYGTGSDYWSTELDQGSTLPLTTLAQVGTMLDAGLVDSAKEYLGFYLASYIHDNGTINMDHWKDPWSWYGSYNTTTGLDGDYNSDSLSDYGRLIDLYARVARVSGDLDWANEYFVWVQKMCEYNRLLVAHAKDHPFSDDPLVQGGLIYGPPEHDLGTETEVYFNINAWTWRGIRELGSLVNTSGVGGNRSYGEELLQAADEFAGPLNRAIYGSAIHDPATGAFLMLPPIVGANQSAFASMTQDTLASYSNFRFWSEILSSGCLPSDMAVSLQDFRETHGGTLAGMTRFENWLDDMPADGYALAALEYDRLGSFLSMLYGHAALYNSPGAFNAVEQMNIQGDLGRYRSFLYPEDEDDESFFWSGGDVDTDFCLPSSMIVAQMTRWQLVFDSINGTDLSVAKGAPRRWFDPTSTASTASTASKRHLTADLLPSFGVKGARSRFGVLDFNVSSAVDDSGNSAVVTLNLRCDGSMRLEGQPEPERVFARLRDPDADTTRRMVAATAGGVAVEFDEDREVLGPVPLAMDGSVLELRAEFQAPSSSSK